ncbi:MAG: hypothetical protein ACREEK_00890 [Bradyrhizobium sp.]
MAISPDRGRSPGVAPQRLLAGNSDESGPRAGLAGFADDDEPAYDPSFAPNPPLSDDLPGYRSRTRRFDDPLRARDAETAEALRARSGESGRSAADALRLRDDIGRLQLKLDKAGVLPKSVQEPAAGQSGRISGKLGPDTRKGMSYLMDAAKIVKGKLGDMTPIYETSRRGVGTISTGSGDPGGISYGSYQLNTRARMIDSFLDSPEGQVFRDRYFVGLKPGTPEFNDAYRSAAAADGPAFDDAQRVFVTRENYRRAAKLAREMGFDLSDRGVQEAVFSASIQHGKIDKFFATVNKELDQGKDKENRPKPRLPFPASPEGQIDLLYDGREKYHSVDKDKRYIPERVTAKLISRFDRQSRP